MLVAIDSGNTNLVAGLYRGDRLLGSWRRETGRDRTAAELYAWLETALSETGIEARQVTAAAIANVVPSADLMLQRMFTRHFSLTPLVIGDPDVDLGIEVRLDRPSEVGADRLVNATAAFARYGGPLIVVDFGTATTFDVVGADGAYLGGAIAPGINLSLDALHRAAAKLPDIAIERPERAIGRSTVQAMQSGIYWGYVSLVEGMIERIRQEQGNPRMAAVATGGLAPLFLDEVTAISRADSDLTLFGLYLVARGNGLVT